MESYSNLVTKIYNVPVLKDAISSLADSEGVLNLVRPDWKEHLENCASYQDLIQQGNSLFKKAATNSFCQVERIYNDPLQILVVGKCMINKPFESNSAFESFVIVLRDSVVMNIIGSQMTKDTDASLSEDCKFRMHNCSYLNCYFCGFAQDLFTKAGFDVLLVPQPCVKKTRIFDGEKIVNRFSSQIKDLLCSQFIAILKLKVDSRVFFDKTVDNDTLKSVRINGTVHEFIAFEESKLDNKDFNLGELKPLTDGKYFSANETAVGEMVENAKCKTDCEIINAMSKQKGMSDEKVTTTETPYKSIGKKMLVCEENMFNSDDSMDDARDEEPPAKKLKQIEEEKSLDEIVDVYPKPVSKKKSSDSGPSYKVEEDFIKI